MACVLFTTAKKNYYLHHNRRYLCSHKEKNGICLIRTCALIKSLSIIIFWVVGTAVFPIVIAFDSKSEQKPITKEKAADCRGGHRILFIHIPKAGGTSIKFALKRMKSFTLWTKSSISLGRICKMGIKQRSSNSKKPYTRTPRFYYASRKNVFGHLNSEEKLGLSWHRAFFLRYHSRTGCASC